MKNRLKVLFLCNGNSCRSQMVHYRRVRDQIRAFVLTLPESLLKSNKE
ncbi:MAG: hypothetical protein NTY65_18050 [Planctomycetota bacterium]|nr:hypothetical protein [Planctomycetota bacterium]